MNNDTVTLDVRTEIRAGVEPLSIILKTVGELREEQQLRLIAPFKPVPLFAVLAKKGFEHQEHLLGGGDWEVIFSRSTHPSQPPAPTDLGPARTQVSSAKPLTVDARGLEPPQPLIAILEALAELPPQAVLQAHTDRRPMHLFTHLTERGFVGESEEQLDGSFITYIRHA